MTSTSVGASGVLEAQRGVYGKVHQDLDVMLLAPIDILIEQPGSQK